VIALLGSQLMPMPDLEDVSTEQSRESQVRVSSVPGFALRDREIYPKGFQFQPGGGRQAWTPSRLQLRVEMPGVFALRGAVVKPVPESADEVGRPHAVSLSPYRRSGKRPCPNEAAPLPFFLSASGRNRLSYGCGIPHIILFPGHEDGRQEIHDDGKRDG
jgi:hypothetical protein